MSAKKEASKKSKKSTKDKFLEEIVLGIDYGERNIGLALGHNGLTMPLHVVDARDSQQALSEINRLVRENKIKRIILGLPLNSAGKETAMAKTIRTFSKLVKMETKLPVVFMDEYATSIESVKMALDQDMSQKRRQQIDHLSAALIIKNYYESLN